MVSIKGMSVVGAVGVCGATWVIVRGRSVVGAMGVWGAIGLGVGIRSVLSLSLSEIDINL